MRRQRLNTVIAVTGLAISIACSLLIGIYINSVLVEYDSVRYYESRFLRVDSQFFEVFDFAFASGRPENALLHPNSIVLSRRACRRYFGSASPVGRRLVLDKKYIFIVTGVIEQSFPTHLEADFIIPIEQARLGEWEYWQTTTYLKVRALPTLPGCRGKSMTW
jgi:putative ABC transport system permease protein